MIEHWRRLSPAVQDGLLAAVVAAGWFGFVAYAEARGWQPRDAGAWHLAGAGSALAMACRRVASAPVLVAGVLLYPALYTSSLQSDFHLVPVLIVAYAAADRSPLGSGAVATACLAAGALLSTQWLHAPGAIGFRLDWSTILFQQFAIAAMVLVGALADAQRRTAAALAVRNAELEALRAVEADRAVALERTRIARELHDDVAHHLTALIVRAQAVDRVSARRQGRPTADSAAASLDDRDGVGWVADTARYALNAVRRTVAVLREEGPASLTPGPSVDDLPSIVARVRDAGLAVRLHMGSDLPRLEPQVQHAVVRVVQESLTNVLRHADARRARVSLDVARDGDGVVVTVDDDGRSAGPADKPRRGLGLAGMGERAASCGGSLQVGRGPLGGWRVQAWFPAVGRIVGAP